MKKAEIRQRDILNHLKLEGIYSYEAIMQNYGISPRTMKGDIAALNAKGFNIVGLSSKKAYELIGAHSSENVFYDSPDRKKIRKLILSLIIASNTEGVSYDSEGIRYLCDKIGNPDDPLDMLDEEFDEKDISKTIENTIEEMLDDGEILNVMGRLRPSSFTPIQMPLSKNDAAELLYIIKSSAKGNPDEEILKNIANKLSLALSGVKLSESDFSKALLYSGNKHYSDEADEKIKELNAASFTENAVRIKFKNRNSEEINAEVMAGILVYSKDKQKTYLIGEAGAKRIVIDVESIISIEETDLKNTIYRSDLYLEIAESMFEISSDDPVHVKVRFADIPSIRTKLQRLCKNRKNALVYKSGDNLIYEDNMSGLNDFAHYLRRFGYGAEVLEPLYFREKMAESTRKLLKVYGEEA